MESFKVIAFTHKHFSFELIGKLHLSEDEQKNVLGGLKINFNLDELLFLTTCNRVELIIKSAQDINEEFIKKIILFLNSRINKEELEELAKASEIYEGIFAIEHCLKLASSLDSLVVGEREILTQVRKSYDFCNQLGLTGDFIRLLIKQTIETAKEIYTNTDIARNPVSVASLAYRQLRELGIKNDARIIFVGSGETNIVLSKYFQKHKFANFTIFNRTLERAKKLAKILKGKAYELSELIKYKKGFDVLIVCTSSSEIIITKSIYKNLVASELSKKVIINLGIPNNVESEVANQKSLNYIDINSIKTRAEKNLQLRKNEIIKCELIIKNKTNRFIELCHERHIELAFGEIPKKVKAIKELAINEVFAKDINLLDDHGKEVLEKVMTYLEKKFNAVSIKTAKEVYINSKN